VIASSHEWSLPAGAASEWLQRLAALALASACAIHAALDLRMPSPGEPAAEIGREPAWPATGIRGEDWGVFQAGAEPGKAPSGPLAKRYRLAGTFFAYGGEQPESAFCKAILDDVERQEQHLVMEGQTFNDVEVLRIFRDHVILRAGQAEEELWLIFSDAFPAAGGSATSATARVEGAAAERTLEENRFGKRVGASRWVLSRGALMNYYREMLEDPERVASLYVSMRPAYEGERIAGYTVDMQGEQDFLRDVGLRQGDVVRRVNSMKMSSQARAEYFISEFVQNRVSAVVLDIERDGQPTKLIYLIR
jgi:type II secretory pathway component PulC